MTDEIGGGSSGGPGSGVVLDNPYDVVAFPGAVGGQLAVAGGLVLAGSLSVLTGSVSSGWELVGPQAAYAAEPSGGADPGGGSAGDELPGGGTGFAVLPADPSVGSAVADLPALFPEDASTTSGASSASVLFGTGGASPVPGWSAGDGGVEGPVTELAEAFRPVGTEGTEDAVDVLEDVSSPAAPPEFATTGTATTETARTAAVEVAGVGSVTEQVEDDGPPSETGVIAPSDLATLPVGPTPGGSAPAPSVSAVTAPGSPGPDDPLEIAEAPRAAPPTLAEISGRWHFEGVTGRHPAGFWFDLENADEIGAGETEPIAGQGANDAAFSVPLPQADVAAWDGRTRGTYHYDPRTGYLDILQRGYVSPDTGRSYSLNIGLVVTKDPRDRGGIRAVSGLFTVWDITAGAVVGTGTLGISPPGSGRNILHY